MITKKHFLLSVYIQIAMFYCIYPFLSLPCLWKNELFLVLYSLVSWFLFHFCFCFFFVIAFNFALLLSQINLLLEIKKKFIKLPLQFISMLCVNINKYPIEFGTNVIYQLNSTVRLLLLRMFDLPELSTCLQSQTQWIFRTTSLLLLMLCAWRDR